MQDTFDMLKKMFDTLSFGALITDKNGKYLYINDAYCKITQRPRSFWKNKTIAELKQEGFLTYSAWEEILETKKNVYTSIHVVDPACGSSYTLLTSAVPYFDSNGEIEYIFYIQELVSDVATRIQISELNQKFSVRNRLSLKKEPVNIIADSPQMKSILSMLNTVSKTDVSILIEGPSGSGKEVIAHYVHENSLRKDKPFIILNCAAIPENLIESELFGYEKGAFTGASSEGKIGLIESASGGTLFLDEINSMSMPIQTKLLRVLETRQVTRVGSLKSHEIDFRLICAANERLSTLIDEHRFRSDLFYRINVISVNIPPLSQRKEDILPLLLHYQRKFCSKYSCVKSFSPAVIQALTEYTWPGNVRELRNLVERLIVTSPSDQMQITTIPSLTSERDGAASLTKKDGFQSSSQDKESFAQMPFDIASDDFSLKSCMESFEKDLLTSVLSAVNSPSAAAKLLKIDLSNVYRKMQKYKIK